MPWVSNRDIHRVLSYAIPHNQGNEVVDLSPWKDGTGLNCLDSLPGPRLEFLSPILMNVEGGIGSNEKSKERE